MNKTSISQIKIKEATAHNLKNIDVQIPHQSLTVITGVSGSGKSSLAYSVLFKESQRRFLSSFSAHSRQFLAKMEKPKVAQISGLQAALAIPQKTTTSHARSTVGTLSGVYDYLRLLFSRVGANPQQLQAKAFSFSSKIGACVHCNGLGVKEQIDVKKLLADENLSIAQGALVPTTPNGYIVYSQVRVDELNKVCQAHDFSVDIPWKSLSKAQQDVIWYGSNRVKILFGKHGLESRLKWKGITAKPREEAYYKGMIPIMEDILHRDRNENILRFASSFVCDNCLGARLNKEALKVKIQDQNIYQLSQLPIDELHLFLNMLLTKTTNKEVISSILEPLLHRLEYLQLLGLEYLSLERTAASLSSGEAQRIRLAAQLGGDLQNILYVLDEPSVGLHARDTEKLIRVLKTLRDQGNTVVVVEHEEEIIRAADYLIDMGPKAGLKGGEVLFQGSAKLLLGQENKYPKSLTAHYLKATGRGQIKKNPRKGKALISISGASKNNLKSIDTQFKVGAFNVVTGVSGAGKSSLVNGVLAQSIKNKTSKKVAEHISGLDSFQGLILVDQSPIGRSSRSIPATYTDVFDHIRTLFAAQALSKERKYKKGQFSFNNKGGRCETCEGVGKIEHKMHLLGNVDIICHHCHGKRFKQETLEVKYKDKNIADILELSINQAYEFFQEEVKITRILKQLIRLDVGYLKLGQSSTTLSGGEAQRIKLAAELYKTSKASKLYILDEPTLGLHKADIAFLLQALNQIVDDGHTVIVIEHDMDIIIQSDWIVDLGPNGGEKGGELIAQASPKDFIKHEKSYTAQALLNYGKPIAQTTTLAKAENKNKAIHFSGLNTHNLKNIEVEIPLNEITLITGVSGSGKSSLAFDSIFAESRSRYTESLSTYARRMMPKVPRPDLEQCHGLTPSVALEQKRFAKNARSTVGTFSEIYDLYRLLFSRIGQSNSPQKHSASYFSFNNKEASCAYCQGMGVHTIADTKKYITHPNKSLILGALDGTNTGRFFGDPYGQYVATLKQLAQEKGIDYSRSFSDLSEQEKEIALYGTGDTIYEVDWQYKRGKNKGSLQLKTPWKGFSNLIKEEYELRKGGKRGDSFIPLMSEIACPKCQGQRLKDSVLEVQVAQQNIAQLSKLSVEKSIDFFLHLKTKLSTENYLISEQIIGQVLNKLQAIKNLGLAYLNIDRNTASLSGGEAQRLRLASQLFFGLQGLTYILDEPSIGLHTHDTKNLIEHLYKLKEKGNTIIMVEHDADLLKIADNIIEMGPGAGKLGGHIIAQGKLNKLLKQDTFLSGEYLKSIPKPIPKNTSWKFREGIKIKGAKAHNLQHIDIEIPSGAITTITGLSGSGKSSLMFEVVAKSFKANVAINCDFISFSHINAMLLMDQKKTGNSPLSTTATYTGIFEEIRGLYAQESKAKELSLKKADFSFNSKKHTCKACKGMGKTKVSLDFLSDVWVNCDSCGGKRYDNTILGITFKGNSIAQLLDKSISQIKELFKEHASIHHQLQVLEDVGIGYLSLGQSTSSLSGGETQRLKLAKELMKNSPEKTLYIFDEPSIGLHFQDLEKLIAVFKKLAQAGHSVVLIEHHLQLIQNSDYLIDLGPHGGEKGGEVLFQGKTEDIKQCSNSYTAKALRGS